MSILAKKYFRNENSAIAHLERVPWPDGPICPHCGTIGKAGRLNGVKGKNGKTRPGLWKCYSKGCRKQFTVKVGTVFECAHSALQLSRDLDCQYKTAFVLAHKLREAVADEMKDRKVSGDVEIDGAYFGGYVKPANYKDNRRDRRLWKNQSGKRHCVVIMRERKGATLPFVCRSEELSLPVIQERVKAGSIVYADEASCWDTLHAKYLTKRINHSEAYSTDDACTNQAESFFSRLRRAEIGTHHHIAGPYLNAYADEMSWREDNRRKSTGELYLAMADAALKHPVSRQWKGYWQREAATARGV